MVLNKMFSADELNKDESYGKTGKVQVVIDQLFFHEGFSTQEQ